jgi:hypothetical protein
MEKHLVVEAQTTARNWNAAETLARILAERDRERIAEAVRALRDEWQE